MKEWDFDEVIDRRETGSLKWDNPKNAPGKEDILPLWVADMDFAAPKAVIEAMQKRLDHRVFGYTNAPPSYFQTLVNWYKEDGRIYTPENFLLAPSVMHALSMAVRILTAPTERIMVIPPIYYPFFRVVRENNRSLVEAPLKENDRVWALDFEVMEAKFIACALEDRPVKALLFSAPHNPVGRVWKKEELSQLDTLLEKYQITLLSDEIHGDWTFPGHPHLSPLDHSPTLAKRTLVFAGPNKTFNLAGLHICHVIGKNESLLQSMKKAIAADFYDQPNIFSLTAATAAYTHGRPWLNAAKAYVMNNYIYMTEFFSKHLPELTLTDLEGTYLAWVNGKSLINRLGYEDEKPLVKDLEELARVRISHGSLFQTGGDGYLRINLACPRFTLEKALERIVQFVKTKPGKGLII